LLKEQKLKDVLQKCRPIDGFFSRGASTSTASNKRDNEVAASNINDNAAVENLSQSHAE